MTWVWRGTSSTGQFRTAELIASTKEEAQEILEGLGITVMSIDPRGAMPEQQMEPIMPKASPQDVPPSAEAASRVAGTIEAMANYAHQNEQEIREVELSVLPEKETVHELFCAEFSRAQTLINERLSTGAKVVHLAMNHDAKGILQVVVVLEKVKE
jgi:hypothetical protein